ncbi:MAG: nuclear transport factor 2 family protein [Xanthobacteraceae bacterium]
MSKKLMHHITKAFEQSDLRPLLEALDENIIWNSATNVKSDDLRFGGSHVGIEQVKEVLATIAADYQFRRFHPIEIVENDNIVWGVFDTTIQHTTTKKVVNFLCALRWRVRNGKLVEHHAFFDTALVLRASRLAPDRNSN